MANWDQLADEATITKTVEALKKNGMNAIVVETGEDAKKKVLEMIPEGCDVMTMTSITLSTIGVTQEIDESPKYNSVKQQLTKMNRETQHLEMQRLGAAQGYTLGSVHAITEDGHVVVVSNTGSQLPAYSYGSENVIWVVGAQKIVKDLDSAFKRVYDYVLPLETVRARKAYGLPDTWDSFVSKVLIVNKEQTPNRITIVLVKEKLGL